MISGHGPSGPLAGSGGNATRTSIGTPSKVGTVLRAVPPGFPAIVWSHRRTPLTCVAHGIGAAVLEKTFVMAASARGAITRNASTAKAATAVRASTLLPLLTKVMDPSTLPDDKGRDCGHDVRVKRLADTNKSPEGESRGPSAASRPAAEGRACRARSSGLVGGFRHSWARVAF